ncbi:MAG: hypothetical protein MJ252_03925 [archaeon]|nr:hypothetical protein [archaeon]
MEKKDNIKPIQLTPEELSLLKYELSPQYLKYLLECIEQGVTDIYKKIYRMSTFIGSNKKEYSIQVLRNIKENEKEILKFKKAYDLFSKIASSDLNNCKVYIALSPADKNEFIRKAQLRKKSLKDYGNNIKVFENITKTLTESIDKITTSTVMDEAVKD